MATTPTSDADAAAAVVYTERGRQHLDLARGWRAAAEAVMEQDDPDDLHGDLRRSVYQHLITVADLYERYSDDCRERAHSARELRRHRYDESFDALHAAGTCRSPYCCGQTGTAS